MCDDDVCVLKGYLTMKSVSSVLRRDIWVRRYMLLCGTQMLYYGSKREYEENPEKPMKARPIDITGYYMYVSGTNPTDKTPTYAVTLSPTELQATGKDNATEKSVAVGGLVMPIHVLIDCVCICCNVDLCGVVGKKSDSKAGSFALTPRRS